MSLNGKNVVVLVEDVYEDQELWYPKLRLTEAGARVVVAGPEAGKVYESKHGYPCTADVSFDQVNAEEIDCVVIPGGYAPDRIRRHQAALDLVHIVHGNGKLVAFICHAGWVPISAKIVKGHTLTSFSAIKDDLQNAGAVWVDEPVVADENVITSRTPDDLPVFLKAIIAGLEAM